MSTGELAAGRHVAAPAEGRASRLTRQRTRAAWLFVAPMLLVLAAVAEHGVSVVPHSWSSAINTAAALHAMACMPNAHVFELKPNPSPMQHELVAVPFEQRDGRIAVPDAPGLGIEVDEGTVRRYAFD